MTKKQDLDLCIIANENIGGGYHLLRLSLFDAQPLPLIQPGQFVEILVPGSGVLLRRPISICDVDVSANILTLMIAAIGRGTQALVNLSAGSRVRMLIPLGSGFTIDDSSVQHPLLIGGGVGMAPLLYLSRKLYAYSHGEIRPTVLLGARCTDQLNIAKYFSPFAKVFFSTEDGSLGEKGFVTNHSILQSKDFSHIYTCGPRPMMYAVARYAYDRQISCEVSLENTMACGVGACLCCVEDTTTGHRCVCTEGPVFNIIDLKWLEHLSV